MKKKMVATITADNQDDFQTWVNEYLGDGGRILSSHCSVFYDSIEGPIEKWMAIIETQEEAKEA
jgi:hypothetical protein